MMASIKSKLAGYKEDYDSYIVEVQVEDTDLDEVNFGRKKWDSSSNKWVLIDGEKSINNVIKNMDDFYEDRIVIQQGVLCYCCIEAYGDYINDDIPKYAKELGYNVLDIKVGGKNGFIYDGEKSVFAKGSEALTTSSTEYGSTTYSMCTPDLSGFNSKQTYYVTYNDPVNFRQVSISRAVSEVYGTPEDWYDYPSKKWANVLTMDSATRSFSLLGLDSKICL